MMRRLLSMLTLCAAVLVAVGPAQAQQGGRGRGRGGIQLSLMRLPAPLADKLALSAEQKSKLAAIGEKLQADTAAARQSAGGDRQAAMQKTRELTMAAQTEASALLNADQKKNWEAWAAMHREIAGLGRSATALLMVNGLTDDQKGKLKTLAETTQGKRRELFQGAQGGNNPELREKAMALETETQTAIKAILTGDQPTQFEAGLAAIPQGRRRQNQN